MADQLTPEHIKSFLSKYKNPADARKFLLKAGLIDELGNLAPQYRSPSPAADAVYEAYCTEADRLGREVTDRKMLAAALKAAADHLTSYSVDQMPGAAFARHRLQVIARELENYQTWAND
jgi:hypothetical protein